MDKFCPCCRKMSSVLALSRHAVEHEEWQRQLVDRLMRSQASDASSETDDSAEPLVKTKSERTVHQLKSSPVVSGQSHTPCTARHSHARDRLRASTATLERSGEAVIGATPTTGSIYRAQQAAAGLKAQLDRLCLDNERLRQELRDSRREVQRLDGALASAERRCENRRARGARAAAEQHSALAAMSEQLGSMRRENEELLAVVRAHEAKLCFLCSGGTGNEICRNCASRDLVQAYLPRAAHRPVAGRPWSRDLVSAFRSLPVSGTAADEPIEARPWRGE